jgi:DNA-binding protein YbaB
MSSGFDAMINSMLAELDKQREEMTRLQAAIASVTATATAPKRQVSVTVDARGEVTELKFLNQSYRSMSPAELAAVIVATIRDAQQQVRAALAEQTGGIGPAGATPADLADGTADWHTAFGEIFSMPESLVEALSKRPTDLLDGVDTDNPQSVLDELRDSRQRRKDAQ